MDLLVKISLSDDWYLTISLELAPDLNMTVGKGGHSSQLLFEMAVQLCFLHILLFSFLSSRRYEFGHKHMNIYIYIYTQNSCLLCF